LINNIALEKISKELEVLKGFEIENLKLPIDVVSGFEPSQFGTIVGTLVDALLPNIALKLNIGLSKSSGLLGEREGYPDFDYKDGFRIELKGLFKDNPNLKLKRPPTKREASARLTQKVTIKNVQPNKDLLLLLCYQPSLYSKDKSIIVPKVVDYAIFPVIELINARDHRLKKSGGRWFGNFETPVIPSKKGLKKFKEGKSLDGSSYGRKENEGKDFNEDTNFGKMKRIPHKNLQLFLKKNGCSYTSKGDYPTNWIINPYD